MDGSELADAFINFFTDIITTGTPADACEYVSVHNTQSLYLRPVTVYEVLSTIKSIKNSASCDIDGIQIRPVKDVSDVIAPILADIFNICLTNSVFPLNMQIAKVTVLYKKGDRNRPVSILPVFSKALEKILHTRFSNFIDKYNLFTPNQFGFRKNRSAELALLEQKEYILRQFENKALVLGIFIDFSKAFDLVNHKILLKKFHCYGIRGHALALIDS